MKIVRRSRGGRSRQNSNNGVNEVREQQAGRDWQQQQQQRAVLTSFLMVEGGGRKGV